MLYPKKVIEPEPNNPSQLIPVGFVSQTEEPTDEEVYTMIDEALIQILGPDGLRSIIKPGDKVVIKVNLVGPQIGKRGEKGRGCDTDPRIVRYVAEKVREIIGFDGSSDLKVVDATFYANSNPSLKSEKSSFYWGRLERNDDNALDNNNICYDGDADGFLDGTSQAQLVNLDALDAGRRQSCQVQPVSSQPLTACLPNLLRTRQEAGDSDEYCDVLIGIPVLKSHGIAGISGGLKLHYGFRSLYTLPGDPGRLNHNGVYRDEHGFGNKRNLLNYLCAEHLIRSYDLVIMDCLTGNRRGPLSPSLSLFEADQNEPVDYIYTNAILASRDPVAIDTVAAVLGGYEPSSIDLLEIAYQNGLGTNDLKSIQLSGFVNFGRLRQSLYERYGPQNRYPFKDGWGDARVMKPSNAVVTVNSMKPVLVKEETYAFEWQIQIQSGSLPELVRAELWINGSLIACKNQGALEHERLVVDVSPLLNQYSALWYKIIVWDRTLTCYESQEAIFVR
ncbi:MAG TPA: hypothetical protein DDW50_15470 [Firmicutes bacterium]|nr:hypothetical protein [Bacillota bacterium]